MPAVQWRAIWQGVAVTLISGAVIFMAAMGLRMRDYMAQGGRFTAQDAVELKIEFHAVGDEIRGVLVEQRYLLERLNEESQERERELERQMTQIERLENRQWGEGKKPPLPPYARD